MRRFVLVAVGLTVLAGVVTGVSGGARQAEASWMIRDLGTLGGRSTEPRAINDLGQIVGRGQTASGSWHGFLWQDGKMTDLRPWPGMEHSSAEAINESGQVVGYSTNSIDPDGTPDPTLGDSRAVLWQEGGKTDLGLLRGGSYSAARAINERGQIVGQADTRAGNGRAFLWQNGRIRDLGTLGGRESFPSAINDQGWIVGGSENSRGQDRAFLWRAGKMLDLGGLPRWPERWAVAINESGQIVGDLRRGTGTGEVVHALLWQEALMTDLGTLGGSESAVAAINERGQIVGGSATNGGYSAFLWQDGKMTALRPRGGANALNQLGQIVGSRSAGVEGQHAIVWQNGRATDLGTLPGGRQSEAIAVNERGEILGWSDRAKGSWHAWRAVLWTLKRG